MAAKISGKNFLAERNRLVDAHTIEAEPVPCLFGAFDDKGRCIRIELISVHPDPAMLGLLEYESESVIKFLVCPKPNVFAGTHIDVGFECVGIGRAHAAL